MKVILKQDFIHLGEEGEVFDVKEGYARNFLIPRGIAVKDTRYAREIFRQRQKSIELKRQHKREEAKTWQDQINDLELSISMRSEEGKLYGSIQASTIVHELEKKDINIDKHQVEFDTHIKHIGSYTVGINLYAKSRAKLKLIVNPLEDQ